ncbi:ring finger domain containing protein [Colletotrichum truncatum]|uniref:Ring finger domain containing protein n=1 Tax=Colletotrichum truncatum TaxID=5467 RepID=A0ACC3Z1V5_COLTU|nr:ring finger domain containing protein [Colletotrichum truncatum]KAF6781365.1 ring finger domain containing protein [Colletotrichum truncatum]
MGGPATTRASSASGSPYAYKKSTRGSTYPTASTPAASPLGKRKASAVGAATPEKKPKKDPATEKRLRRFRSKPPQNFDDVYSRALTQRFYVLERRRCGTAEAPEEEVELTGSTGNIYTVTIAQRPSCSCPHFLKGNQCKHWLYVMSRVLHAKFEYTYQLALLTTELKDIFDNAPPIDTPSDSSKDKNRKPVEGDCPICFCELESESKETIVWCRAACGQNIHKTCFETWAATKRKGYGASNVTCPFCRSVWQGDDDMIRNIKKGGRVTYEGYVNVADQLGISAQRDHSTYSRWRRGY